MRTFIPTPSTSKLELGPVTLHFYAISILLGILFAILITRARYQDRGGDVHEINDLAFLLVPVGIIGGRIYHLITSPDNYFGQSGHPLDAFKIWQGGLGIWGAIGLGSLAAYLNFRRGSMSVSFLTFADSIAPALLVAQGVGRFGNWFNAELFGRPSKLPWALEIPYSSRPSGYENFTTFHPTFLYEALWCFAVAIFLTRSKWVKNLRTGHIFLSYIALYCLGRLWIEALRIDTAHEIFGVRLNVWVSAVGILISAGSIWREKRAVSKR